MVAFIIACYATNTAMRAYQEGRRLLRNSLCNWTILLLGVRNTSKSFGAIGVMAASVDAGDAWGVAFPSLFDTFAARAQHFARWSLVQDVVQKAAQR